MERVLGELEFRSLLVAIDGSQTADLALSAAVRAARRDNAKLTLLAVSPNILRDGQHWVAGSPDPRTLQDEADKDSQKLLRDTLARIPDDIPATIVVRHGKPGPEIVAQAKENDYDAILLGARGLGRVRALMGSVSGYVMHHATINVFIAHEPAGAEPDDPEEVDGPGVRDE